MGEPGSGEGRGGGGPGGAGRLRLAAPWRAALPALREMAREYAEAGDPRYAEALEDADAYLARVERDARGANLPPKRVRSTELWMLRGDRLLGGLRLRHRLIPRLERDGGHLGYDVRPSERGRGLGHAVLGLGLEAARAHGLERVLLTCDAGNAASARVIERAGGAPTTPSVSHHTGRPMRRYWIDLGPRSDLPPLAPGYAVRPARPEDLDALPAVERAAARLLAGHLPDDLLRETTAPGALRAAQAAGLLWVARLEETGARRPVGFALVGRADGEAHLEELDVHPDHGRRGLGAALVRAVIAQAAVEGRAVTLTTFDDLPWNGPFYRRLGFRDAPAEAWGPELRAIVRDEIDRRLDPARRVVLRYGTGRG